MPSKYPKKSRSGSTQKIQRDRPLEYVNNSSVKPAKPAKPPETSSNKPYDTQSPSQLNAVQHNEAPLRLVLPIAEDEYSDVNMHDDIQGEEGGEGSSSVPQAGQRPKAVQFEAKKTREIRLSDLPMSRYQQALPKLRSNLADRSAANVDSQREIEQVPPVSITIEEQAIRAYSKKKGRDNASEVVAQNRTVDRSPDSNTDATADGPGQDEIRSLMYKRTTKNSNKSDNDGPRNLSKVRRENSTLPQFSREEMVGDNSDQRLAKNREEDVIAGPRWADHSPEVMMDEGDDFSGRSSLPEGGHAPLMTDEEIAYRTLNRIYLALRCKDEIEHMLRTLQNRHGDNFQFHELAITGYHLLAPHMLSFDSFQLPETPFPAPQESMQGTLAPQESSAAAPTTGSSKANPVLSISKSKNKTTASRKGKERRGVTPRASEVDSTPDIDVDPEYETGAESGDGSEREAAGPKSKVSRPPRTRSYVFWKPFRELKHLTLDAAFKDLPAQPLGFWLDISTLLDPAMSMSLNTNVEKYSSDVQVMLRLQRRAKQDWLRRAMMMIFFYIGSSRDPGDWLAFQDRELGKRMSRLADKDVAEIYKKWVLAPSIEEPNVAFRSPTPPHNADDQPKASSATLKPIHITLEDFKQKLNVWRTIGSRYAFFAAKFGLGSLPFLHEHLEENRAKRLTRTVNAGGRNWTEEGIANLESLGLRDHAEKSGLNKVLKGVMGELLSKYHGSESSTDG